MNGIIDTMTHTTDINSTFWTENTTYPAAMKKHIPIILRALDNL